MVVLKVASVSVSVLELALKAIIGDVDPDVTVNAAGGLIPVDPLTVHLSLSLISLNSATAVPEVSPV